MTMSERVLPFLVLSETPPRRGIFVALMVAAVPALAIIVDHGGSVPTFLLFCFGIGYAIRGQSWRALDAHEWWLLGAVAMFCAVSVLWAAYGGWTEEGRDKMEEHLRLLQFIPIYILLRQIVLRHDVLWIGLIAGAVGAGIVAAVQVTWLNQGRADGAYNAIQFGSLSLIMGFAALSAAPAYARRGGLWSALPWIAFVAGISACVLSGTRGALIFLPVGAILAVAYFRSTIDRRIIVLLLLLPVVVIASALAAPGGYLSTRLESTIDNITAYEPGGERSSTSVGRRLDMWITSARIIAERPITGVGLGRFRDAMQPYVDRGMAGAAVLDHTDAHNVYIDTQLTRGVAGTVALLMMLGIPVVRGLAGMCRSDLSVKAWAYVVAVIATGYAVQGLTSQLFELGLAISFFSTPLAASLAGLENARRVATGQP